MREIPAATHRANVEWDGRYYVAVPESGGVTQAERLDQLSARVAEVIRLVTGEDVSVDDIVLDVHDGDDGPCQTADERPRGD